MQSAAFAERRQSSPRSERSWTHDREICFPSGMEKMGPVIQKLYDTLTGIQMGPHRGSGGMDTQDLLTELTERHCEDTKSPQCLFLWCARQALSAVPLFDIPFPEAGGSQYGRYEKEAEAHQGGPHKSSPVRVLGESGHAHVRQVV